MYNEKAPAVEFKAYFDGPSKTKKKSIFCPQDLFIVKRDSFLHSYDE